MRREIRILHCCSPNFLCLSVFFLFSSFSSVFCFVPSSRLICQFIGALFDARRSYLVVSVPRYRTRPRKRLAYGIATEWRLDQPGCCFSCFVQGSFNPQPASAVRDRTQPRWNDLVKQITPTWIAQLANHTQTTDRSLDSRLSSQTAFCLRFR